jgi:diaminohydroxyphosphoribosylaminopyrimidine deaminase/5-amino-6-(5-phosphoribosylamino)uracil reductase
VKQGKIIAQGYHKQCGKPHAEIEAFNHAIEDVAGADIYVTLEPCCHFGRTGPCVDEIIKRKIKRVVIAVVDPNPKVNGKAIKKLIAAGIKVVVGVGKEEAIKLNEIFFKNMKRKLPFVAGKIAQSLDGKTVSCRGISKWITSLVSRNYSRRLRDNYDAVLVGINTIVKDDPQLNGIKKIPFKIVIDAQLKIPLTARIFKETPDKVMVITAAKQSAKSRQISSLGARVVELKLKNGLLAINDILRSLYDLGIMSIFVEGGGQTLGYFFDASAVDKIYFFLAPKILGGKMALTSVTGQGFSSPFKCAKINDCQVKMIDNDILVSGYPVYP